MRGLTIRQPWAWAVTMLETNPEAKRTENRSSGFNTKYRGLVLIHSSKAWSPRGAEDERVRTLWGVTYGVLGHGPLDPTPFVMGSGLAVAELVDVHPDMECCRPWGESEYVGHDQRLHRGVTHLVWGDVEVLEEPVPCRGALGLWTVPADVVAAVEAQLL